MSRKLYECGICDAHHPQTWNGDCRDDANRLYDLRDDDEVISWDEMQALDDAPRGQEVNRER